MKDSTHQAGFSSFVKIFDFSEVIWAKSDQSHGCYMKNSAKHGGFSYIIVIESGVGTRSALWPLYKKSRK